MSEFECKIKQLESLTPFVWRILLEPTQPVSFKAGQYVRVVMGETDKRPFSIANGAQDNGVIELHVGASEHNPWAMQVIEKVQQGGKILLDGPHGKAQLRDAEPKPTILMAGGTGFSYTWSILQTLLAAPLREPVFLYWGTKTLEDMYALDALQKLAAQHAKLTVVPVLENPHDGWLGRTGLVHQTVLEDFISLEPYQVYVAGRFEMAGVARDAFHQQGLLMDNLFGDAYEFI